jgi:hypothetical protein
MSPIGEIIAAGVIPGSTIAYIIWLAKRKL